MNREALVARILVVLEIVSLVFLAGCGGATSQPLTNQPPPPRGTNPVPTITTISPGSAMAGGGAFTLTINGANFVAASMVNFGGSAPATTFINSTQLTAAIPVAAIVSAGTVAVTVTSPSPGGGASNAVNFTITGASNPVPTIVGLTQNCAQAGGQEFSLSVLGSNFVSSSVVRWNGSDRPTAFDNSGQLTARVSASDIASPGTAAVTVFNPAPGGGISNTLMLAIATGGVSPRSVVVEPAGNFAYVANAGCPDAFVGSVTMYRIDLSTGLLQYIGAVKAGTASETVATDPTGKFTYVTNEFSNDISTYAVDATTGMLTSRVTINSGGRAVSVTVHPSGKFAYVANGCFQNNLIDSVSMYMVDTTTGALTHVQTIPTGATGPSACSINIGIALDPSGTYAYVAGDGCGLDTYQGYVSTYTINPNTGALTSVGQPVGAGYCSDSVSVDHFSKFAYVTNNQDDDVSIYSINATTGALKSLGTATAGSGPVSSAVHPSAKFAYVANFGSNDVSIFGIDSNMGTLTFKGTIAAELSPTSIAIHPSGMFAYVTNSGSNSVSMYSIDINTGALTLIGTVGT